MWKWIVPWTLFVLALAGLWYFEFRSTELPPTIEQNEGTATSTVAQKLILLPYGTPSVVEAYLAEKYECPPCKNPGACAPCDSTHLVISSGPGTTKTKVYMDRASGEDYLLLKTGKWYSFVLEKRDIEGEIYFVYVGIQEGTL